MHSGQAPRLNRREIFANARDRTLRGQWYASSHGNRRAIEGA